MRQYARAPAGAGAVAAPPAVHRGIEMLLKELAPANPIAWREGNTWFTADQLRQAVSTRAAVGQRYAQALLTEFLADLLELYDTTLAAFAQKLPEDRPFEQQLQRAVQDGPTALLVTMYRGLPMGVEAWRTETKAFPAHEFADKLERQDPEVRRIVSDILRVCRDILARKALD